MTDWYCVICGALRGADHHKVACKCGAWARTNVAPADPYAPLEEEEL